MTFFPVAKKEPNAWRGCLDGRPVNELLEHQHFKMEGIQTVRDLIRCDDWMTTVDITEAFPHLAIHPADRQYLRFVWNGVHYQYKPSALVFRRHQGSSPSSCDQLFRCCVQRAFAVCLIWTIFSSWLQVRNRALLNRSSRLIC